MVGPSGDAELWSDLLSCASALLHKRPRASPSRPPSFPPACGVMNAARLLLHHLAAAAGSAPHKELAALRSLADKTAAALATSGAPALQRHQLLVHAPPGIRWVCRRLFY